MIFLLKKYKVHTVFFSVCMCLLFLSPSVLFADDTAPLTQIDSLQAKVAKAVPSGFAEKCKAWFSNIDTWRQELARSIASNKEVIDKKFRTAAVKKLELQNIRENPTIENSADRNKIGAPLADSLISPGEYFALYFWGALLFVVGNQFIFYLLAVLVAAVLIRAIIRGIRRS